MTPLRRRRALGGWPRAAVPRVFTSTSRPCPFCGSEAADALGVRRGASFVRCHRCRSIYRDLTEAAFAALHDEAQTDEEFVETVQDTRGLTPNYFTWDQVGLEGRTVIEIGPGSGHLLAAARDRGFDVFGVETNPGHRRFIRDTWGIDSVYPSLDDLPPDLQADAVVAVNVFEHVYDLEGFLREVSTRLRPGGRVFISTVNAGGLALRWAGTWFSMFKDVDHVSFPTREGFVQLAARSGLTVDRTWSGELPFETPVGLAVALRDWRRERTGPVLPTPVDPCDEHGGATGGATGSHRVAATISRLSESRFGPYEPSQWVTTRLGRASSIMVLFVR